MDFWQSFFKRKSKSPLRATQSFAGEKLEGPNEIPSKTYRVKYLGFRPTLGLWGVKHTRKPVDSMVEAGKRLLTQNSSQLLEVDLTVTGSAVLVSNMVASIGPFPIETIAYGVQDIVYNKVFAMIVLQENTTLDKRPFLCFAFLCDTPQIAESIALALAHCFKLLKSRIAAHPRMHTVQLTGARNPSISEENCDDFLTSSEA